MRRQGKSILQISRTVGVSKGTVSVWCRDIALTPVQIQHLLRRKELGLKAGQLHAAENKRSRRIAVTEKYLHEGCARFISPSEAELFSAGLALYLAEGAKTAHRIHFVNSDPRLIEFMLQWLERFFGVPRSQVAPSVLINEIHRPRIGAVLQFWSSYLDMPISQFRGTVFVKTIQRKVYANHDRYYGTFRFQVLKGTELWYKISGLMEGLLQHIPKPA